jgi:hypothetical protein
VKPGETSPFLLILGAVLLPSRVLKIAGLHWPAN